MIVLLQLIMVFLIVKRLTKSDNDNQERIIDAVIDRISITELKDKPKRISKGKQLLIGEGTKKKVRKKPG